jgi:hypothetical protein
MNSYSPVPAILILTLVICSACGYGDAPTDEMTWTNENKDPVINNPEHPTMVSFPDCVRIIRIATLHHNYGKGDLPGSISIFHQDGTGYGPWGTVGAEDDSGVTNAYWISYPGETLKPGTYLITDSHPDTRSHNDASDNTGMANITYELVDCPGQTRTVQPSGVNLSPSPVPEMENAISVRYGDIDPRSLAGEETETLQVPDIRQVSFDILTRNVTGEIPVSAMLTVKNVGTRNLQDGYLRIRLISTDGKYAGQYGMAEISSVPAGETVQIPLILPTGTPDQSRPGGKNEPLACQVYRLEGTISELMNGGYFAERGTVSTSGDQVVSVIGCCTDPKNGYAWRSC